MTRRAALVTCVALVSAACAARAPARPAGSASPDPAAAAAFAQATRQCAGLTTLTAEIRLSGRAGSERIRGTLHAGLAAPAAVRFEALAPFGPPVFILAGRDNRATLLLPRDNRVLPDAAVPQLLERLTGLALAADDLRFLLSGCLSAAPVPADGRAWPGGWRAVTISDGITAYMKEVNAAPAIVAADHGAWRVDYANHQNGWPRTVRIRRPDAPGVGPSDSVDITAALEQVEINAGIADQAFAVAVPAGASPMTIDDLRAVAPLRGSD